MSDELEKLRKQIEDIELRNKLLLQSLQEAHRINELWGNAVQELMKAKKRLQLDAKVMQCATNGIVIADHNADIVEINPAFTELTGYTADDVLHKNPRFLQSGKHDARFYQQMWRSITADGSWKGEIWSRHKTGALLLMGLAISVITNKRGETTHFLAVYTDITQQKQQEEYMLKLAYYDPLTQLPNRVLLYDRLNETIKHARRTKQKIAVLFFDLDYFKQVNDSFGHHIGDKLLIAIAKKIVAMVREEDTIARLGGDEFVVVIRYVKNKIDLIEIATKIIATVQKPLMIDGNNCQVGASIGICVYPTDSEDPKTLVKYADQAMYKAKQLGRNRFIFYDAL